MKLSKQDKRLITDLTLTLIGVSVAFIVPIFAEPTVGFFFFLPIGITLTALALLDAFRAFDNKPLFPTKPKNKNKKGVVWIWAVAVATLVMAAVVFFIASYPLDLIIEVVLGHYEFTGTMGASFNLVRQIVAWLLGITVFIVLIWGLVNAHKRGADYPAIG